MYSFLYSLPCFLGLSSVCNMAFSTLELSSFTNDIKVGVSPSKKVVLFASIL